MNEKTLKKSPVVIVLYVVAALMLIYDFYLIGSTISQITSYYAAYGVAPALGEVLGYIIQTALQPLVMTILLGAAAFILNEVRALNPANYATKEELEAAKAAKQAKKQAAKLSKEEAKLEISIENADAEPTVVFESVEATSGSAQEEALQKAEESL